MSGGLASGKSAVLRATVDQATEKGFLPLAATGSRAEAASDLGLLSQLFQSPEAPPELRSAAASLLDAAATRPAPSDAATAPRNPRPPARTLARQARELADLLIAFSREQPLLLAVDDVQFADPASLEVLLPLRRRLGSARVLMVFAEWSRPSSLVCPMLAEYTQKPYVRIPLAQLTRAGTEELLAAELGPARAAEFGARYYSVSGGNPLLLQALADDLRTRAAAGLLSANADGRGFPHLAGAGMENDTACGGMAFRRAVLDCLHRWDERIPRLAQGLAILGDLASRKLLHELLGLEPEVTGELLEVLELAGLTRGGRLRHPELVASVLESLPSDERTRLHSAAAELLYERGAETLEIARHIVHADTLPGSWALHILRQAASKVANEEDVDLASRGLELALRECEERDRMIFRSALVDLAWQVNPAAAVRHLPLLQKAIPAGELSSRDLLSVVRHLLWQGDLRGTAGPLRAMLSTAGPGDARIVSQASLCHELIHGRAHEDLGSAIWPSGHPGLAGARTRSRSGAARTASPATTHELLQNAERILQGQINDTIPEASTLAILVLDESDQSRRALDWCETLLGEANRQGAVTWQAMLGSVRAALALRRGDMLTAQRHAGHALDLLHQQSWGVLIGLPLSSLILAHTATGDHEKAGRLLERTVPDAMFETALGLRHLHASGHYHLAVGRPFAAIDDFERCGRLMRERNLDTPTLVPWRTDLSRAHLQLGDRKRARTAALEQLEHPNAAGDVRSRGVALRLLAATSPLDEQMPLLLEAIEALDRCGDRLERARALADLAQTHQDLGELTEARRAARRADQEAKACGAEVLLPLQMHRLPEQAAVPSAVPHSSGGDGAGTSDRPTLSDAERKVATLAAYGHSNREIGQKLYITVSTVEQHLTRAYRKLNVNRRTDLPTDLAHHFESA